MIFEMNKWRLFQCQDEQIAIFLLDSVGEPVSISGATEIHAIFLNADGTKLEKVATSGWSVGITAPLWVYSFNLSAAEMMALAVGPGTVEVRIMFGASTNRFLTYPNQLTVSKLPF